MGEECDLLRARRCREVMVMELLEGDLRECGIAEQMRINNGPMKFGWEGKVHTTQKGSGLCKD